MSKSEVLELIETLNNIEKDVTIIKCLYLSCDIPLVEKAVCLADRVLVDDNGQCNWEIMKQLEENGFNIVCTERDRFGWLCACVLTSKGRINYG